MGSQIMKLGPAVVEEAMTQSKSGVERPWIRVDEGETGLQIRVEGKRASWLVRYKGKTITLARVGDDGIKSAKLARSIAADVRDRIDAGLSVDKTWVAARRLGHGADEADSIASRKAESEAGRWRWEDLVEAYVEQVIAAPTVTTGGRVRPPSAKTVSDARRYLLDQSLIVSPLATIGQWRNVQEKEGPSADRPVSRLTGDGSRHSAPR